MAISKKDLRHIRIASPGSRAFLFDVILKCVHPGLLLRISFLQPDQHNLALTVKPDGNAHGAASRAGVSEHVATSPQAPGIPLPGIQVGNDGESTGKTDLSPMCMTAEIQSIRSIRGGIV